MKSTQTMFAPAERADPKSVSLAAQLLTSAGLVHHVTNALPCIVLILNKQRQVVYKNQRLMELLGASSDKEVLGKRPGELLDCIHANESPGGCGTTEFCRECGAAKGILESQIHGITAVNECRIITNKGDAYNFRVWASPYTFDDTGFTVFSVVDIGDEKRRHALERTFFHDVNNILMVITGYSEMLEASGDPERSSKYVGTIQLASKRLVEEIASHRRLLQAENGELSVDISNINSLSLLNELVKLFSENENWRDRSIVLEESSDEFEIATDRALLLRVLNNMLKNALEASSAGEEVLVGCTRRESTGVFSVHNPNYMPRSIQLQVFQRAFSTKGKGRGIGTYSMKLFGEKYLKGKVWSSTSEEEGTTFYASVPLVYPEA